MHNRNEDTYIVDMDEKLTKHISLFITPEMENNLKKIKKQDNRVGLSDTIRALIQEAIQKREWDKRILPDTPSLDSPDSEIQEP